MRINDGNTAISISSLSIVGSYALNALLKPHALNAQVKNTYE